MELQFKNKQSYACACTMFTGNDYKYVAYIAENAIRFFTHGGLQKAKVGLAEVGIFETHHYNIIESPSILSALNPGFSNV